MKPIVAIVGRPNVGKSTLFNRLVGQRLAIVDDIAGVTRARRHGQGRLGDLEFTLIDTAGLEAAKDESLAARMTTQTEAAIAEADVALLVIDARAGVTPVDEYFAKRLRKGKTPVILVANKSEGRAGELSSLEGFRLGLGQPVPISAEHGEGLGDLYDALKEAFDRQRPMKEVTAAPDAELVEVAPIDIEGEIEEGSEQPVAGEGPIQIAIVGRPNVGKSTLVNALIGAERMLTGPEAGITRDAIAIDWTFHDRRIRLVDTAGLRRRARITEKLERLSSADTKRAIRYAHIVLLVLDAADMLEKQDLTIARDVIEEGRALLLIVNKWDAVEDKNAALKKLKDRIEYSLPQVKGIPVVTISALSGRNLDRMMEAALKLYDVWNARVPTSRLNRWLNEAIAQHPPPLVGGRRIKLRYMTQVKTRPPTFALFAAMAEALPDAYHRYLVNALRAAFDLPGTPVRLILRRQANPFDDKRD